MTALEISKERLRRAKQKSLVDLLKQDGYKVEDTGSYYRCLSPLRTEGNGSFDVSKRSGRWKDRGKDKSSGDVVDFVMQYKHMSFKEAVDFLLGDQGLDIPEYVPEKRTKENVEILSVEPLSDPTLMDYIAERKIRPEIAQKWLVQLKVRFPYSKKSPEKIHSVIGFKNDSGGYEMRCKYIKVSSKPKNVTTIIDNFDGHWNIFEGWPDFLSYLTHFGFMNPPNKTIILNSLSFVGAIIPMLRYKWCLYYGQNDKPGERAFRRMKHEGVILTDKRHLFEGHKDFNQYLQSSSKGRLNKIFHKIAI